MAQQKKTSASKKNTQGSKNTRNSSSKKKNNNNRNSLFNAEHRVIVNVIAIFFAVFMGAVVFIDGGNVWGSMRSFFFGLVVSY